MKKTEQKLYSSPNVKVVEIKARKVLCQSPSGDADSRDNETYETGSTDGWF